jgi:carboxyl-terminal processing protease
MTCRRRLSWLVLAATLLGAARSPAFDASATLDRVWADARDHLFDSALAERFFGEEDRLRSKESWRSAPDVAALADSVNRYFDHVPVSHLHMVTADDLEFYVYGSTWSPRRLDTLEVPHIGIQWARRDDAYVIRGTLEGYPAESAGLRRGDVIVSAGGRPFHPIRSFAGGGAQVLTVRRGLHDLVVRIQPVREAPIRSLLEAMRNSTRRIDVGPHHVGYIHLWTCLSPLIEEEFARLVRDSLGTCDGIILDLRDGIGGGWTGFLDPFFPDRRGYAEATVRGRSGRVLTVRPDSLAPHPFFAGPMVALINEGTRSGKEAIAFEMKQSKRARLVGVTTTGAFRGGQFYPGPGYILMVPLNHLLLGGQDLEGRGVVPDVESSFPLEAHAPGDPQLERGLVEMRGMLDGR